MSYPLAVVAPHLGAPSETFIRRHMRDLLPGGTVVVAGTAWPDGVWSVDAPTLLLDGDVGGRRAGVLGRAAGRIRPSSRESLAIGRRFLQRHGVEVILGEYLDLSLPWLEAARSLGVPLFVHAHGYDVSERLRDPAWRRAYLDYNGAAGIISMSETGRRRLVEIGLDPQRVHVVPYGVDVPAECPSRVREGDRVRCLSIGRFVPKKAPILTLDAFRRAAEAVPGLTLDYVGSGELFPAARQFVRAFGLEDRVTLHGAQPSEAVARLLAEADIYLQHSMTDTETGDEEGLPVAILEAMAQALPVVATKHAAIPEAVADGVTGYLVDEGDSAGMGERLVALARDSTLRASLGEAAWRRATESFTWERERQRLLALLGLHPRPAEPLADGLDLASERKRGVTIGG